MQFPESFFKADENGFLGYMEVGFISTTSDKQVALQYSGIFDGKPEPTVIEFVPSSVCRGACVREFSQYPAEQEYLFPACSFVEPRSDTRYEATENGPLKVIAVSITSKIILSDEILHSRKNMHLTEFQFLIQKLESRLPARLRLSDCLGLPDSFNVFEQCRLICSRHASLPPDVFLNHVDYQQLLTEMMDAYRISVHFLEMHDELCEHNLNISSTNNPGVSLRDWLRTQLSDLKRTMKTADCIESQHIAMKMCSMKGLIQDSSLERFDRDSEPPIVKAAADGASRVDVFLLLMAGAKPRK